MKVYDKLAAIQAALKAPKSQYNSFGKYNYRKAEDILEAVKPLLAQHRCVILCNDELVQIGERYYVKATASLIDCDTPTDQLGAVVSVTAFAREEETKAGMDGSQITGASSSYARKYALNGLLCIDDTADSDTTNTHEKKDVSAGEVRQRKRTPASRTAAPAPTPAPAAPAAPAQQREPVALEYEVYQKWVKAIATHTPTKAGRDSREVFIEKYAPSQEQLTSLDKAVLKYQLENNIQ